MVNIRVFCHWNTNLILNDYWKCFGFNINGFVLGNIMTLIMGKIYFLKILAKPVTRKRDIIILLKNTYDQLCEWQSILVFI